MGVLDKYLQSFSHKSLSDSYALLQIAERHDVTVSELMNMLKDEVLKPKQVSYKQSERVKKEAIDTYVKVPCIECGQHTKVLPVNTSPATMVEGSYKSVMICHNCMHSEYSDKTVAEIIQYYRNLHRTHKVK